jgi:hypothetical protein
MGPIIASFMVVLAMAGISLWGARALPPGARVPLHYGFGGYGNWQPKTIALITYPVVGLVLCGVAFSTASARPAVSVIFPIALLLMAFGEYRAIVVALRRSGRD